MTGMYKPGEVEVAVEHGISIVRLLGEHDLSTQQLLTSTLARLIDGLNPVVFDVASAEFFDTTVMTAIKQTQIALAQKGIPVALVIPEPPPRRVLTLIEVLALNDAVVLASSADDARRKLLGA